MKKLLEAACAKADRVEIFHQSVESDGVSFENGKLKDIDSSMLRGLSITLMKDGRLGMAYTRNLRDHEELIDNALASLNGGVKADYELGSGEFPSLHTMDASIEDLSNADMVAESERLVEILSSKTDGQVNTWFNKGRSATGLMNSSGLDISVSHSYYSAFFGIPYPGSYAFIPKAVRGKAFVSVSDEDLDFVIRTFNASQKEIKKASGKIKVLFMPFCMHALISRLSAATNARTLYEKVSPLRGKEGEEMISPLLTVGDAPLDDTFPGARSFDDEGSPCSDKKLFENGVFKGFYTDRYYAWKLGIEPGGNGWRKDVVSRAVPGLEHLYVSPGKHSFDELLTEMNEGVIVFGALGAHSGNILNGDYSIGLSPGLWVENGEIAGHVKDSMIAGNVYEDLKRVVALGDRQEPTDAGNYPAMLLDGISFASR